MGRPEAGKPKPFSRAASEVDAWVNMPANDERSGSLLWMMEEHKGWFFKLGKLRYPSLWFNLARAKIVVALYEDDLEVAAAEAPCKQRSLRLSLAGPRVPEIAQEYEPLGANAVEQHAEAVERSLGGA